MDPKVNLEALRSGFMLPVGTRLSGIQQKGAGWMVSRLGTGRCRKLVDVGPVCRSKMQRNYN